MKELIDAMGGPQALEMMMGEMMTEAAQQPGQAEAVVEMMLGALLKKIPDTHPMKAEGVEYLAKLHARAAAAAANFVNGAEAR